MSVGGNHVSNRPATEAEMAALMSADHAEIVTFTEGFGLALDVRSDDDPNEVTRQYFVFEEYEAAQMFVAMLQPN